MEIILKILNEIRPENDFVNSKNYIEDGLLESMDIIELVSNLEKEFGIEFDIMDMVPENFMNLKAMDNLIQKYGK